MALFSIFPAPDFPGFLLFSRQVKGYETKTLLSFGHIKCVTFDRSCAKNL